jgi:hypothetical protein
MNTWKDEITDDMYDSLKKYLPGYLIGGSYALYAFEKLHSSVIMNETHIVNWAPNDIDIFITFDKKKKTNDSEVWKMFKRDVTAMIDQNKNLQIVKNKGFRTRKELLTSKSVMDEERFHNRILGTISLSHDKIPKVLQLVCFDVSEADLPDCVDLPAAFFFKRVSDRGSMRVSRLMGKIIKNKEKYEFPRFEICSSRLKKYESRGYVFY